MTIYINQEVDSEPICAGDLKVKDVYTVDELGRGDYIKVLELTKVKTGKHGAAKVIIKGKVLNTGKNCDKSYTSAQSVTRVSMKKLSFVIEEVFDETESFYMKPNDNADMGYEEYPYSQIFADDVAKILEEFKKDECRGKQATMTLLVAPNFVRLNDVLKFYERK